MTPKEKAEELVDLLYPHVYSVVGKAAALDVVNLIIDSFDKDVNYWQEVKIELEKL
jgi:hypothetical protein